jgi:hypothetical protein
MPDSHTNPDELTHDDTREVYTTPEQPDEAPPIESRYEHARYETTGHGYVHDANDRPLRCDDATSVLAK